MGTAARLVNSAAPGLCSLLPRRGWPETQGAQAEPPGGPVPRAEAPAAPCDRPARPHHSRRDAVRVSTVRNGADPKRNATAGLRRVSDSVAGAAPTGETPRRDHFEPPDMNVRSRTARRPCHAHRDAGDRIGGRCPARRGAACAEARGRRQAPAVHPRPPRRQWVRSREQRRRPGTLILAHVSCPGPPSGTSPESPAPAR